MRHAINRALGKLLRRIVVFRSHEFRITALDLLRRTPALRGEISPLNLYLDWRHDQVQRLNLQFYRDHPVGGDFFQSYYGKIDRVALVASFLQGTLSVPGDVAEFGVYMGHTAIALDRMLAEKKSQKQLFLFDSFSGMPEVTHPLDQAWKKGDLASSMANVRELFRDSPRVKIVPGYFSETLPQNPHLRFAFCHVDADLYTSIKECIAYILPRLSVGGVIVFDDYGFRSTPGAKEAVEEYFGQTPATFVPLPTAQAVYFKRSGDGVLSPVAGAGSAHG